MPDQDTDVQLFLPDSGSSGSYSEARSQRTRVRTGEWQELEFRMPPGTSEGRLRLDPGDLVALIEISEIVISPANGAEPLWSLRQCSKDDYELGGTSVEIPCQSGLTIFSHGSDPQIVLPETSCGRAESSVRLLIRIRTGMPIIAELIHEMATEQSLLPGKAVEAEALRHDLEGLRTRLSQMEDELQLERLQVDLLRGDLNAVTSEYAEDSELARVREERDHEIQLRDALLRSWSWRLTLPIRLVAGLALGTIRRQPKVPAP